MSDDQSDLFVEETSAEDKFFGVKTTFDKKAKEEEASDVEFEVVDDRPEEDRKPSKAKKVEASEESDEELGQYSDKVQKRLNKLKFDYHEERRQREAAEKLREEAITYAQQVANKNQEMESLISRGEAALVEQVKERAAVALDSARSAYRKAYEEGNTDEIISSQEKLNRAQAEYAEAEKYQSHNRQQIQQRNQYDQQAHQQEIARQAALRVAKEQQQHQNLQPQQPPAPSPEAKEWADRNDWFMKEGHEEMTALAYGAHTSAVQQGMDTSSQDYFDYIDNRMRTSFPDYDWQDERSYGRAATATANQRPSSVVAPSSRSNGAKSRKVQLTSTQVSLAKRLGLSPEQYANQLIKERK
jgi:hypothetical protein